MLYVVFGALIDFRRADMVVLGAVNKVREYGEEVGILGQQLLDWRQVVFEVASEEEGRKDVPKLDSDKRL